MDRCCRRRSVALFTLLCSISIFPQVELAKSLSSSSPFSSALDTLQKQIGYDFHSVDLLRRAMTHPSFSEENNRGLSILGASAVQTFVALRYLQKDIDIPAKELSLKMAEIGSVERSCAVDGIRLGLEKVVRVAPKSNVSESVVCGAFRAIFGAIAIDVGGADEAASVFWRVHRGGDRFYVAM
ncbi:unnamed protein product [Rhodiola kirilowii]